MRTRFLYFGCMAWLFLLPVSAGQPSELHIKAAFLYKFCGYTVWPTGSFEQVSSPINIGVMGNAQIVEEFTMVLQGKQLGTRPVEIHSVDSADDLTQLHALYIESSEQLTHTETNLLRQNLPILTVTDADALSELSVIHFSTENSRVRFAVSQSRAEKIGLHLSSQLLSVALRVE
jgi:YfiR/HmsC-like